jgi:hypothetical protein
MMIVAPLSGDHTSGQQQSDSLLFLLVGCPTSLIPTHSHHSAPCAQLRRCRARQAEHPTGVCSRRCCLGTEATRAWRRFWLSLAAGQYLLSGPTQTPDTRHSHLMNTNWRATRRQQTCLGIAFYFWMNGWPPSPPLLPAKKAPSLFDMTLSKLLTHLLLPPGPLGQVMLR